MLLECEGELLCSNLDCIILVDVKYGLDSSLGRVFMVIFLPEGAGGGGRTGVGGGGGQLLRLGNDKDK